ncbi:MAG TPA: Fur family transcriptional regulator [Acidimicrobiales bacterium]|nr:Fur family transcriptional regulator [Acidimicrobiales bacterium]
MTSDLHATVATHLRRVGQRYTTNRRALVGLLEKLGTPVSIPELLQASEGLAQSSVYRNLAVLEQADVVHRIVTSDDFARYELAEGLTEHHHHLICSSCGMVADFTAPDTLERQVATAMASVASANGFTAEHHRLDLIGTCARCS